MPPAKWPWSALELYERLHTGNAGDVAFYVEACRGVRSVLELGCGGGRVLLAVGQVVDEVVGVDSDPEALEALEARLGPPLRSKVTLTRGDMCRLALGRRFDRVIIPYNTLYALPGDDQMVTCLDRARRHLTGDGRVVFDGYLVPDDEADTDELVDEAPAHLATLVDDESGRVVDVQEQAMAAPGERNLVVRYDYRLRDGAGAALAERAHHLAHHYLTPRTLPGVVRRAGLRITALFGDFAAGPVTDESDHLIVVAEDADALRR